MKVSLDLQDDQNPVLKAKLPISIFNQPFTSIFATTTTNSFSDLSVSFSTNFTSGPSLRVTYNPSTTTGGHVSGPFSFSLKSGLGLFGSPHNSPLIFSANFSLSTSSSGLFTPTFSLHFKPQLGHFSLHKKTNPTGVSDPGSHSGTTGLSLGSGSASSSELGKGFGFDGQSGWQELKLEPFSGKDREEVVNHESNSGDGNGFLSVRELARREGRKGAGVFSGVGMRARTVLPVTKRVVVNLRWGVHLPGDYGVKMPYLTVNKIGIERIEERKEVKKESNESNVGDLELLKGMCFWMRRDLEVLEKENRDMKQSLEDMRLGVSGRNLHGRSNGFVKKAMPASVDSFSKFERPRPRRNDEEANEPRELNKPGNASKVTDLESELQKAIKAASS